MQQLSTGLKVLLGAVAVVVVAAGAAVAIVLVRGSPTAGHARAPVGSQTTTVQGRPAAEAPNLTLRPAAPNKVPATSASRPAPAPAAPPIPPRPAAISNEAAGFVIGRDIKLPVAERLRRLTLPPDRRAAVQDFERAFAPKARERMESVRTVAVAAAQRYAEAVAARDEDGIRHYRQEQDGAAVMSEQAIRELNDQYYNGLQGILTPEELRQLRPPSNP
jgi:hypothetical protein